MTDINQHQYTPGVILAQWCCALPDSKTGHHVISGQELPGFKCLHEMVRKTGKRKDVSWKVKNKT